MFKFLIAYKRKIAKRVKTHTPKLNADILNIVSVGFI